MSSTRSWSLCLVASLVLGAPGCVTDDAPTEPDTALPEPDAVAPDELKVAAARRVVRQPRPLQAGRWIERDSGPQTIKPTSLIIKRNGADWPLTPAAADALPAFPVATRPHDRAPNVAAKTTILLQRNKKDRSPRYVVYDLEARTTLLTTKTIWPPASPYSVLLYADDQGHRQLFDLRQKRPLHIRATYPPGVVPKATTMAMHARTGRVLVLADTADDRSFLGLVDPMQPRQVFLNIEMPFSAGRTFGSTTTVPSPFAWQAFQRQHRIAGSNQVINEGKSCPLLSIHDKLGPVCRPHPPDMNSEKLVDERYRIDGNHVFDDLERVAIRLGAACPRGAHIIGHWAKPVRVLAACLKDNAPWFELWSPHHSLRFSARGDIGTFRILRDPIRSLQYYKPGKPSQRRPYVEVYIDLERARVFTGGQLVALPFSESFGHRRHMLATSAKNPRELWRVDLNTATAVRIAKDHGCSKAPHFVAESQTRQLISCVQSRSIFIDGPARRRATLWSEVVDFTQQTRTRIDDLALPAFADNSRLVVGNDRKNGRIVRVAQVP